MDTVSPEHYGLPRPSAAQKLTPLDMNLPRVYGARWTLCFSLESDADKAQVFENLRVGLARTIVSIPWIAGHIGPEEASDPDENRIEIVDSSDGVLFPFKDLSGDLPSFAELQEQDFPLRHLPSAQIFPVGIMPGSPALVFAAQANFIAGGLVLTAGIHHAAGDAVALQTILDTWARNAAAVGDGTGAFTTRDAASNDRGVLMTGPPPADPAAIPEWVLSPTPKPDPAAPPPSFQMPPMETRLFRFAPARLAGLKAAAAAYSSHDALCAFLWCAVTRARAATGDDATSAFAFAVNVRPRADPPLPPTYLGNASMLVLTERLAAPSLTAPDGVPAAAAAVRQALRRYEAPERIPQVVGMLASRRNPTDWQMAYRAFLGPDVVATSWADVPVYATRWGDALGAPVAFRAPADGADGVITILPRRRDGGLDVQLGLESGAMARLLADEDFGRVAEARA